MVLRRMTAESLTAISWRLYRQKLSKPMYGLILSLRITITIWTFVTPRVPWVFVSELGQSGSFTVSAGAMERTRGTALLNDTKGNTAFKMGGGHEHKRGSELTAEQKQVVALK